ncbi:MULTISPECIES: XrtA/PEP-CTERM system histidine kinase PrsK [unclassified Colwellia]|uniref:XrtA/PEP-CTERM system histidine kinase PrsK n=1 Tax=unclassified Colwellia TaxID=196834 RepID=UPI0015F3CFEC|nr:MULTISPECIES: XrtA/PEP-CTERM system histidine kinase PrsK [unclassified Colwellia]MBA6256261.1 PEP-CTERM system histidine kinase PrsK [Colwellia sp. MB3u-28]MBA6260145.1 PEP-CTERM system histidine kinase PrsK [Colwellia sp. MB3u-41]
MDSLGLFGYSLASAAYFVFALLIFAARNNTTLARWVLISTLVTVIANVVAALQIKLGFSLQWAMFADAFKIACWSLLIVLCNTEHPSFKAIIANYYIRQYVSIWGTLMLVCWLTSSLLNYSYEYIFLLFIVLNLWSLVLLEQLYRSANSQVRWAILPMVLALASVAIFDFILYAQATMVDGVDFNFWFSRGYISLMIFPLLLISTRRIRNGSVRIFVSRHVVFYSSMLMIAGIYLLVMALAGYVINYIGGEWGSVVSISFLMLGSLVLVALLITESLRRKLKVFIAKNFFANKYEYRDEWLNLIGKIETTNAESYYQMATQIMMSKVDAYGGAILKKVTEQRFSVQYSENIILDDSFNDQLIHCSSFCQQQGWIIDIDEYKQTPTIYPNLSLNLPLIDANNIRIVVPIFIGKAFYGMFFLVGKNEVKQLNWEDRDLLFAISKQLGNFISLHEANDKLAESKQFDAFNRMSAFLVHDLKNVQAQLALISTNAKKHRDNPDFIADVFETVESATERLSKVLSQLRNKQMAQSESQLVDMAKLISSVVEQRNISLPLVTFEKINSCEMAIHSESFHSVLNHLIQNAQEATNKQGWVKVQLTQQDNHIGIKISDNGCGMSKPFINNRLFKPFDTTKGNAGMGIGVFEAKQFIEGIAGLIKVESIEGQGTTFIIDLPINPVYE